MDRPADEHKDFAASKHPLLPSIVVTPNGSSPEETAQIFGCHVLIPIFFECKEIERSPLYGGHNALLGKARAPPR
jgi:hypothetical protein